MTVNMRIVGLERVKKKLNTLQNRQYMEGVMFEAVSILHDDIAEYPPATEANSPARNRWYERGYGSRYRRKDGSIGGKRTSETLGRRWTKRVENRGTRGVVGNNASYAPYVQDKEFQSPFHKTRGWDTAQDVMKRHRGEIRELLRKAIHKIMSR